MSGDRFQMEGCYTGGQAAVIEALPEPSILVTGEGRICAANQAYRRMLRLPTDIAQSQHLVDAVIDPPEQIDTYLRNCAGSRQPVLGTLTFIVPPDNHLTCRCEGAVVEPWSTGAPALILVRLRPRESIIDRFVLLNRTIHELNQEIRERRQVESRLRVLVELSSILATTLEYHTILQRVGELLVGHFADWCILYLVEAEGGIERVVTTHVNPLKLGLVRKLTQALLHVPMPVPFTPVIESGQSILFPQYDEAVVLQGITDVEQISTIRQIDPRSIIAVSLRARGQILGAIVFAWTESDRRYDNADLSFAEELASRTALAVENARLYQEARTAEAQLREFNHTLEHLVAERTFELERSNQELDQFAYVASHDLKAPLRAINHLTNWLADDAGDVLPAAAVGHLTKIRQRVGRMERLLNDLLAYSRAGRQFHTPVEVDCTELVHSVAELVAPSAGFVINVSESLPVIHTERVPLETVFRNLLSNAVKHHDHPAEGTVWVTAHPVGELIEFAVADNGPGIEPQFHGRIFEAFQALKPRDQAEGSGVGLAIVKKIVELRGGIVRVVSQPGQGATFYFTWPLTP